MADIKVYEWNGHTWAGWWKGDKETPVEYKNVQLRELDTGRMHAGMPMTFDVPNGDDWSSNEKGIDRHVMEGTVVDFYSGDFTLEGFVKVEFYGASIEDEDPEPAAYRKQRWVVTNWKKASS